MYWININMREFYVFFYNYIYKIYILSFIILIISKLIKLRIITK